MTRTEKKELIYMIHSTLVLCYKELISVSQRKDYEKIFKAHRLDESELRKELRRTVSDLNCDTTPGYKLEAYSARTLQILEDILAAEIEEV